MNPEIDPSTLTNHHLSELEQQILVEQSRRVMSSPTVVVVESDSSDEAHDEAIQTLLQRKAS